MQISDWISIALAAATSIGVLIALFVGIRSIRQNRTMQLVRFQNDLLEKISNWVTHVQNLYSEVYLIDLYQLNETTSSSVNPKSALALAMRKRARTYREVLEEGRNMYGIAMFISKDLDEAVKSLETCLHNSWETLQKSITLIEYASSHEELSDIIRKLDKDRLDNLKSIDESVVKIIGKILSARIDMLDSITGADPFRNA